jgi:hypothetical protein
MALGAPPHLISSSIQAQTDELAHARACLSVVSLLSGEALGPDTLNISSHTSAQPTAEQVLVDSILEGCINETLAAAEAAWLSENCQHPRIRKVLRKIAKDEERHSALGWKVVSWILEENPSYAPLAAQTFATLAQSWEQRLIHPQGNERIAFGQLSQDEARILHAQVWETIIHPCAQSILRSSTQKEQSA